MSLDLRLISPHCPTCNHSENTESLNYTYNVSKMWRAIFPDAKNMVDIDGLTGEESLNKLKIALEELDLYPDKFTKLNPENGWGTYEGFKRYIQELIIMARHHLMWVWEASR